MKTQRAVLPLAFLSAAFMLGCQDQGLEPVGPEGLGILLDKPSGNPPMHNHDSGGAEGIPVDVDLTGGIVTDQPQPARLVNDNGAQVSGFSSGNFLGTLNLTPSVTFPACRTENNATGLAAFLTKDIGVDENEAGEVNFIYEIKLKKMSGRLSLSWVEPDRVPPGPDDGKRIRVAVNNATATADADQTRFTFTGGGVGVSRSIPGGTFPDRLICPYPGLNVVLVLNRSP